MLIRLIIALALMVPLSALAAEVAPLGFNMDTTRPEAARARMVETCGDVKENPKNALTGGYHLRCDGKGFGVEGLGEVNMLFTPEGQLIILTMELAKDRYNDIFGTLIGKYPFITGKSPPVGNQSATFKEGVYTIYIKADHLATHMFAIYSHPLWDEAFARDEEAKAKAKSAKDRVNF